jgi:uncharacterized protein YdhG (YjbR/CyaY superfamily)
MKYEATTVDRYIESIPEKWKEPVSRIRSTIKESIPPGFEECISYGMIGYVVPLSRYPSGYHAKKGEPLPFINIAAQKDYVSIYHLGIYAKKEILDWFIDSYEKAMGKKPDIGKSCMRFRSEESIPYDLISELVKKIGVDEWISMYEKGHKVKE